MQASVPAPWRSSAARHAASFGVVVALHLLLLVVLLAATGTMPALLPALRPARLIMETRPPPPPPPRVQPRLPIPPLFVPTPEIEVAQPPPRPSAPRAITRIAPEAAPASHFGAATDTGLGLGPGIGTTSGGGAGTRGTLAGFEATVRARVLRAKRQPALAWDRRNTCVVNYRVTVARGGALAGFSIDPCAVGEINEAARDAIRQAAPFPPPPDLGAPTFEVHGSLIFHP